MTRAGLTRDRIVSAAVALADAEGTDALSMRRLGAALGCDGSALYRHLASKQALVDAVTDRIVAEADLPTATDDPWQDVRAIALAVRAAALAHPRLAPLLAARPPVGPGGRAVVERLVATLARAGLAPDESARALQLLVTLTLSTLADPTRTDQDRASARRREVTRALRVDDQAPQAAQAAALLTANDDPQQFAFALDVVLAGLQARAAAAGT